MDEITETQEDSAQVIDQTSEGEKESTSKAPPTYTEEDYRKGISDALAEQGRRHKAELEPIKQERDTLKSKVEEATENLESTKTKISDLESDLEQAMSEDADLRDIAEIKKQLRAERDQAKLDVKAERDAAREAKRAAEAERLEWAETVAEAQAFKFDSELIKLVDDYAGDTSANFTKLKAACDKAGIKTKDGAEALADILWAKKGVEPEILDDSGVTSGGGKIGKRPSLEELRSVSPAVFEKKIESGEWVV